MPSHSLNGPFLTSTGWSGGCKKDTSKRGLRFDRLTRRLCRQKRYRDGLSTIRGLNPGKARADGIGVPHGGDGETVANR